MENKQLLHLTAAIAPVRKQLLEHPIYTSIDSLEGLQRFMAGHIFAVWDFMSLLKALQVKLTCVTLPWRPVADPEVRHLINEIVLSEESDQTRDGRHLSHFELYHEAMQTAGASTAKMDTFLTALRSGEDWKSALKALYIPIGVRNFVEFSIDTAMTAKPHEIAAVFTFGREELIPDMFQQIIDDLHKKFPAELADFIYYLDRHVELDADEHGPMALRMVAHLCGDNAQHWKEAEKAAIYAIQMRKNLWDAVLETMPKAVVH